MNEGNRISGAAAVGYGVEGGLNLGEIQQQAWARQQQCGRRSAKDRLRDRVHELRKQADALEALGKALPEELPITADAGLWDLLSK